ncbi:MAG TPA: M20 family metallopeptidase [Candidatus Sumerlaeota bacterium]|nr:MAG: p-aminobenzoyl-glutamate hydrolase subunit B [candidate division BRC1 bacterium ADurb.Bin183]HQH11750.1 M20 family metallopeptidase [Candidatus Sumerlaeota bacterium]HRR31352.1 M20 family metallopeptidase [Candidatus Sumerlaeia bacterium]HRS00655.1 M20 family metallopeptidase [Candidatus Sumerlaeia bacterium]
MVNKSLRDKVIERLDSMKQEAIETSHFIHANPEPGLEEFKASERLTEILARHGFAIEKPVGNLATAFKARAKGASAGPRIAFLAEYDSLGLLGHACGHNIIGTASTFAGIALQPFMKELPGETLVIGTPGEESFGGKVTLLQNGVFADVDIAMMVHPSNETRLHTHSLAMQLMEFEFHGRASHAAAMPWQGINALDALIQMFISVDQMRKQQHPSVRTPGVITYGGERPNVVPDRAVGLFSCRGKNYDELQEVIRRVENCARGAALATGATVDIRPIGHPYKEIRPNPTLSRLFEKNFRALGGVADEAREKGQGSVDIGNISHVLPCIHPNIKISSSDVPIHTDEFRECAASPAGDEGMLLAAKTLALTALDVFMEPELLNQMKKEMQRS